MKRGFTLVELAIVLVIIGLLIGGILVAQSMISTVRLQGFVREIQQYDIAVSNFKTKYGYMPGDAPMFPNPGNGDGNLNNNGGGCANSGVWPQHFAEGGNFWMHLQQGGFLIDKPAFTLTISGSGLNGGGNYNVPISAYYKNVFIIAAPAFCSNFVNPDIYLGVNVVSAAAISHDYYMIRDMTNGRQNSNATYPVLTAEQAFEIDSKMDDGKPLSGMITAGVANSCQNYNGTSWPTTAPGSYNLNNKTIQCELSIRILAQVNQQNP